MNINPIVRVWSKPLDARQRVRDDLVGRFGRVPDEYVEIAETYSDLECEFSGQYFRIWGGRGAVEFDDGYGFSKSLPGSIPFGDDGGGQFFAYVDGERGRGVYRGAFGVMDPTEIRWVAASLTEMLEHPERANWD